MWCCLWMGSIHLQKTWYKKRHSRCVSGLGSQTSDSLSQLCLSCSKYVRNPQQPLPKPRCYSDDDKDMWSNVCLCSFHFFPLFSPSFSTLTASPEKLLALKPTSPVSPDIQKALSVLWNGFHRSLISLSLCFRWLFRNHSSTQMWAFRNKANIPELRCVDRSSTYSVCDEYLPCIIFKT